ncbi:hypothetical protein BS47DRAFT_1290658 [Hydnum rufescens UP504]|uniref:NADH:flavin oxidoreductase/NADH oxidase N-terminal domain-containing protein n=1 Tax=Hydnum rufescens UP504 TaxID=1448309 RepID=A0A9P6DWQ1_9AGAM|nr:hypothetical protein BS47DRAFT_1290658 [Hydnum rufescens UP504]
MNAEDAKVIASPVRLPCGRTVQNRLAAMYENLAQFGGGPPNEQHFGLYRLWGQGGWGIIITGNVQISRSHLSLGRDICVPETIIPETVAPFQKLSRAIHGPEGGENSPLALMQLSHCGRQSPRFLGGRSFLTPPIGASNLQLSSPDGWLGKLVFSLIFAPAVAATDQEIDNIVERFVMGAKLALESGFDGVQLHGAHGYLISQFLSPKTNNRPPPYGPSSSLYFLRVLVTRIRAIVPPTFILALKVNCGDYVQGGLTESEALEQLRIIAGWQPGIDIIEISGGDYERPDYADKPLSPRQIFFSSYARKALEALQDTPNAPRIMLTGSLQSQSLLATTIRSSHADLLGIGRPSIVHPSYALSLLSPETPPSGLPHIPDAPTSLPIPIPVRLINAGVSTAWWNALIYRQAVIANNNHDTDTDMSRGRGATTTTNAHLREFERIGPLRATVELFLGPALVSRLLLWAVWIAMGVSALWMYWVVAIM